MRYFWIRFITRSTISVAIAVAFILGEAEIRAWLLRWYGWDELPVPLNLFLLVGGSGTYAVIMLMIMRGVIDELAERVKSQND